MTCWRIGCTDAPSFRVHATGPDKHSGVRLAPTTLLSCMRHLPDAQRQVAHRPNRSTDSYRPASAEPSLFDLLED